MDKRPYMIERGDQTKELPGLYPGMLLEVLTEDNRLIFVGRIEWVEGNTLQIVDDRGMDLPYVEYNSYVKLRGFYRSHAVALEGMIGGSSARFWRIDRLRSLQVSEQREYFRQNTSLDARVMCVNEIFGQKKRETAGGGGDIACHLVDISAGGALLRTKGEFKEGDWLFLRDVKLLPEEPPFTFTCVVKRVISRGSMNDYGCEFMDLSGKEQDRLIRGILALQRRELLARRGSGERF